jgi:site-specific DNA-methyltransferase (adenine-specific)
MGAVMGNPWKRREVIGDCTLYLGDCLSVLAALPDESVDMIWTDPPYGHSNADGDLLSVVNSGKLHRKAAIKGAVAIQNDDPEGMRRVVDGMLTEAARLLRRDCCCCCCCCCCCGGGPRPTFAWLAERMDRDGLAFFHSTIWDKVNPGLGWRYKRQHEMVMVSHRKGGKLAWAESAVPVGNIFRNGWLPGNQRQHPNEKPLWLVEGFVNRHTERNGVVLDPFLGGGTTLVACAKLGRKGIGIEIDPDYFDIACERVRKAYDQPDLFIEPPAPRSEQLTIDMEAGE